MARRRGIGRRGFKRSDKRYALRMHAKRRAFERYGITLNRHDVKQIVQMIRDGSGKFLRRQSRIRVHWEVEFRSVKMRVVYDSLRDEIITFLPFEDCAYAVSRPSDISSDTRELPLRHISDGAGGK